MWLQAFEALGPQVYINIPLCVEWSLIWVPTDRCVRWTQLTGSQGLKEIVPCFLHHASQCRPSGRVMCGAGRCSCDLSWPWRKRVNRLDWKARHFWDCFQSPAWGLFQVRIFTPPSARLLCRCDLKVYVFSNVWTTRKFLMTGQDHVSEVTHYSTIAQVTSAKRLVWWKALPFTLTRKPLFLPIVHNWVSYCIGPSLLVETDFGQCVAVHINACFMQENMVLVAFKEFWHCMCIFVDLLLDL